MTEVHVKHVENEFTVHEVKLDMRYVQNEVIVQQKVQLQ